MIEIHAANVPIFYDKLINLEPSLAKYLAHIKALFRVRRCFHDTRASLLFWLLAKVRTAQTSRMHPRSQRCAGSASCRGCQSNETVTSGVESGRGKLYIPSRKF